MALIAANNALKAFSIATTALAFKMAVTLSIQGGKSFDAGARPPEDNKFVVDGSAPKHNYGLTGAGDSLEPPPSSALLRAREVDFRWKRIVQNDLENIPIGLAVLLGAVLVGGHETTNAVLIGAFTVARIAHTCAYANELQPHRAIFWGLGQLFVHAAGLNGDFRICGQPLKRPFSLLQLLPRFPRVALGRPLASRQDRSLGRSGKEDRSWRPRSSTTPVFSRGEMMASK